MTETQTKTEAPPAPAVTRDDYNALAQGVVIDLQAMAAKSNADQEAFASALLEGVPESMKALIPTALPPAQRVAWFTSAKKAGVFDAPQPPAAAPRVPGTDTAKPSTSPAAVDLSKLPPIARMAAGYGKTA